MLISLLTLAAVILFSFSAATVVVRWSTVYSEYRAHRREDS
ncbi:hypothetical protein AB0K34_11085 [Actinomadura sp. NPDC049382]